MDSRVIPPRAAASCRSHPCAAASLAAHGSTPAQNNKPRFRGVYRFGGGGSRTRVLTRGGKASTGLGGHSGCRGAGGGPPRYRLRIPLDVPPVPRAWRGVSPGRVTDRTRRSERGAAGSVAIGAYAARAKLPLSLAIKGLPRVGGRHSTCDPRAGP